MNVNQSIKSDEYTERDISLGVVYLYEDGWMQREMEKLGYVWERRWMMIVNIESPWISMEV
jgi:hypothetical protein